MTTYNDSSILSNQTIGMKEGFRSLTDEELDAVSGGDIFENPLEGVQDILEGTRDILAGATQMSQGGVGNIFGGFLLMVSGLNNIREGKNDLTFSS